MYSFNARRNDASPNRMSLDRHSCRMEPTQRSAKAFRFGLLAGRANDRTPLDRRTSRNAAQNFVSRIVQNVLLAAEETGTLIGGIASHLPHPFGSWILG